MLLCFCQCFKSLKCRNKDTPRKWVGGVGGGLLSSVVQVLLEAGTLPPSVAGSHRMAAGSQCATVCAGVWAICIKASQVYYLWRCPKTALRAPQSVCETWVLMEKGTSVLSTGSDFLCRWLMAQSLAGKGLCFLRLGLVLISGLSAVRVLHQKEGPGLSRTVAGLWGE